MGVRVGPFRQVHPQQGAGVTEGEEVDPWESRRRKVEVWPEIP